MQITHIRNLFYLSRHQIIGCLFLLGLCCPQNIYAQAGRKPYNYLDFTKKLYYFGITLAYNTSNYRVVQSKNFIRHDSITSILSSRGPGFNLGIVSNLKIGEHFDIRFLPTLSFTERRLDYTWINKAEEDRKRIASVFVETPLHVRYKTLPYKDFQAFVLVGVKYGFDMASNSRARNTATLTPIKVAASDFAIEYGAGFQIFFPYFILSPEIKISQGLGNVLIYNKNQSYTSILDRIFSRAITISFHFEG